MSSASSAAGSAAAESAVPMSAASAPAAAAASTSRALAMPLSATATTSAGTDRRISQAAPVSLYGDAPLTCQFLLEDHAVRHSYHHLSVITRALAPLPTK